MKEFTFNRDLTVNILKQIENAILLIKTRTSDITSANDFLTSPEKAEKLDAVCMQFIAIGESIKGLDKVTSQELLKTDDSVPWRKVMGLRDVIAHHYFDVDAEQIWWIIENELDALLTAIQGFIKKLS